MILLLRFIKGFVKIFVSSDNPERFINICAINNIELWNFRRSQNGIYMNISIKDYKNIRKYKNNANVHIKLINKYGLPIFINPYKKRYGLIAGAVSFIIIQFILSMFIWNIEVKGNKTVSTEEILSICNKNGISEGALVNGIDTNDARLKLLINNKKLSWASFIIEGSHLTVNVLETKNKSKKEDNSPSNLVAKYDGVIKKTEISSGRSAVNIGQGVVKGDLLVSGAIEFSDGRTEFVKSRGKIYADTVKVITVKVPLNQKVKIISGNEITSKILSIYNIKIPINFSPPEFEYTKKIIKEKIKLFSGYSPIFFYNVKYKEIKYKNIHFSQEEALEKATKIIKDKEKKILKNIRINSFKDYPKVEKGVLVLKRVYKLTENIAISQKIKINTTKK